MDARPIGEGVAGFALRHSGGVVVEDVSRDVRFSRDDIAGRYNSKSFAVVPLTTQAQPLGVLCVTDRAGGDRFGQEDLALLRLLALQLTAFIASRMPGP